MNDNDLHELATPFALDAIEDDERRMFETHLETCGDCLATVDAVRGTLGDLSDETAVAPPAAMRDAVLQRIAQTPQEGPAPTPLPVGEPPFSPDHGDGDADVIPIRRRGRWLGLVTTAAGIAAVFIAAVLVLGGDTTSDVIGAPDARIIQVEAPAGTTASLTFSAERMQAVFTADDLAEPGDDSTYQLWVIAGDVPRPAGTFVPDEDGSVQVLLDETVETGQVIGLTIEPAGGSPAPTGDILVAQPVT